VSPLNDPLAVSEQEGGRGGGEKEKGGKETSDDSACTHVILSQKEMDVTNLIASPTVSFILGE